MSEKFTQKYTIVQLIRPLANGAEYSWTEWPLHVTLADVFAIDLAGRGIVDKLADLAAHRTPFAATAGEDAFFGPKRNVRVTLLDKTAELDGLHRTLIALLQENGVVFNSPQFTGTGFTPHATVGSQGRLRAGEIVHFDALTLIDMFPDDDHLKRRVIGTFPFLDK